MSEAAVLDAPVVEKPAVVAPAVVEPAKVEAPAADAPPSFDWRKEIAGEDEKALKGLERFPDLKTLHKAFEDNQKALRDSGRIKLPGKDATDDDRKAFAKTLGVPEKADGYKIDLKEILPPGMTLDDSDKANLKTITELFHAEGGMAASPETVRSVHKAYVALKEAEAANQLATEEQTRAATEKELKQSWGTEFKLNMDFANAAVGALFGADQVEDILSWRGADGSLLGDNKAFMRAMATAGRALAVDPVFSATMTMAGDPKSVDDRIKEIQAYRHGSSEQKREYDKLSSAGGELEQLYAKRQALRSNQR